MSSSAAASSSSSGQQQKPGPNLSAKLSTESKPLMLLSQSMANKVRSAAARVFVHEEKYPQHYGCGALVSPKFVITASHVIPKKYQDIWVLLGRETTFRKATVALRMEEPHDIALLELTTVVKSDEIEPLVVSFVMPEHMESLALVGFHQPLEKRMNNMHVVIDVTDDGVIETGYQLELKQALIEASIESFALSTVDPKTGVGYGWYPCFGGDSGSVIVNAKDGSVVGVHTQMLWLSTKEESPRLVHSDDVRTFLDEQAKRKKEWIAYRLYEKQRMSQLEANVLQVAKLLLNVQSTRAAKSGTELADAVKKVVDEMTMEAESFEEATTPALASSSSSSSVGATSSTTFEDGEDTRSRSSSTASFVMDDIGQKNSMGVFQILAAELVSLALANMRILM